MDKLRAHAGRWGHKTLIVAGWIVIAAIALGAVLLHVYWPFTASEVRSDLASATSSDVSWGHFHTQYFPPGCVAENVTFREPKGGNPLVSVRRLTIETSLSGLLRHRISLIKAEGLQGQLVPRAWFNNSSTKVSVVNELVADDAVLETPEREKRHSLQFRFHKLSLSNVTAHGGVTSFAAVLELPLPPGLARVSGQFGPWRTNDAASTAISGKYSLQNADLSVFHSIAGSVSSTGTFHGNLSQVQVEGSTQSPKFMVTRTQHVLPLNITFQATVETHTGNVVLPYFNAKFGRDEIAGSGSIARRADGKRSMLLDLNCPHGRIEDTFYPFIRSARSPLFGDVNFHMQIALTSGHSPFLQKLNLRSDFKIQNARFTNLQTETRVSEVSAPPDQEKTQSLAEFQGDVQLDKGVARFRPLIVHDDEAYADFLGLYNVENESIDLHGKLKTAASLTKTTHGVKSIFAKVIEAFFKKRPHETVVPVHIGGTYSHPNFGLDL